MSKNERKWSRLTPEAMKRIADQLTRAAEGIDQAARLLETAAASEAFDLSDAENTTIVIGDHFGNPHPRKPPGEDGGDRGG